MRLEIIENDGRFGPGRMNWLLVCDEKLISHCGLRWPLEESIEKVRAAIRNVIYPPAHEAAHERIQP